MIKTCVVCNKPFESNHPAKKCCCEEHTRIHRNSVVYDCIKRWKHENGLDVKICSWCGNEYTGTGRLYCSPECRKEANKKEKALTICANCGKGFVRTTNSIYCGRECRQAVMVKRQRELYDVERDAIRRSDPKDLVDNNKKAKELGISYGEYMALKSQGRIEQYKESKEKAIVADNVYKSALGNRGSCRNN